MTYDEVETGVETGGETAAQNAETAKPLQNRYQVLLPENVHQALSVPEGLLAVREVPFF